MCETSLQLYTIRRRMSMQMPKEAKMLSTWLTPARSLALRIRTWVSPESLLVNAFRKMLTDSVTLFNNYPVANGP